MSSSLYDAHLHSLLSPHVHMLVISLQTKITLSELYFE